MKSHEKQTETQGKASQRAESNHEAQPSTEAAPKKTAGAYKGPSNEELLEQLQRLQAEFENYRKRIDAQGANAAEQGKDSIIKDLLPIVDALELAIRHADTPEGKEGMLAGVIATHSQLKNLLENWKVDEVSLQGAVDPRLHEVYLTETTDKTPANTIIETLQKGYTRNGTILRTAKIKAARAK